MSFKQLCILTFSFLGLIIPMAFLFFARPLFPNWVIYIWPSSIFLLATSGHEKSAVAFLILVIAVGANIALYTAIGWVVGKALGK